MTYEFKLPDIGEGVVEGEVVRWLVKEGDSLREDQPMVEIMTDKATVEIPAPRAGRVAKRMYAEGAALPGRQGADHHRRPTAAPAASGAGDAAGTSRPTAERRRSRRRTAAQRRRGRGGARGRQVERHPDRERAGDAGDAQARARHRRRHPRRRRDRPARAASPPTTCASTRRAPVARASSARGATRPAVVALHTPARETADVRVPFRGVRKKIAENLVRSKHTAAHFTYVEEIDCTDLVTLRRRANERLAERGVKLSFLPFVIKATVAALKKFPQLNATLDEAARRDRAAAQLPHRPRRPRPRPA